MNDLYEIWTECAQQVEIKDIDPLLLRHVLYKQAAGLDSHHACKEISDLYPAAGIKVLHGDGIVVPEEFAAHAILHPPSPAQRSCRGHIAWFWEKDAAKSQRSREKYGVQTTHEQEEYDEFRELICRDLKDNLPEVFIPLIRGMAAFGFSDEDVPSFCMMYVEGAMLPRVLVSLGRLLDHGCPEEKMRLLYEPVWFENEGV